MMLRYWLDTLVQDVTFGVRSIRQNPLVAVATVGTLMLGIGMSAGIFSLINAIWLRPPVEKDPGDFVRLFAYNSQPSFQFGQPGSISLEDYRQYESARSLSELAAWHQVRPMFGGAKPTTIRALLISCNFFSVYGLDRPEVGRLLTPQECSRSASNSVAVISDEFWHTQLNAVPDILGRVIFLNRRPFTVVGVTPPHFSGRMSLRISAWIPYMYPMVSQLEQDSSAAGDFIRDPSIQWLAVEGRRKPGYSIRAVQAELAIIAQQQDLLHPGRRTTLFVTDGSGFNEPGQRSRNNLLMVLLMGSLILLVAIASANVASLLLAKAAARRKEVAIRLSLGARRSRLLRMILTEGLLLAVPAGCMSLFLAYWLPRFLGQHLVKEPLSVPLEPDFRVFIYLAAATLLAGCIASLTPAAESLKRDHLAALKGQESVSDSEKGPWLTRNLLISAQLAASFVALIGAGVFAQWYNTILNGDPGFAVKHVMVVPLNLQAPRYSEAVASSFYRTLEERMRALPGVKSLCYTDTPPFEGSPMQEIRLRGQDSRTGRSVMVSGVSIDCLKTLGIQVRGGRVFDQNDVSTEISAPTVVISQAFAHSFWPNENPIDKVILEPNGRFIRVVGVVRDTKSENFGITDGPRIYHLQMHPQIGETLIFGFEGDSTSMARNIGDMVKSLDTDLIVTPRTVRSEIDDAATAMRGLIELMIILASGTVLLALIGIYGVVWFTVSRRTKEMGIRIALGATRQGVVYQVLRSNMRPVYVGLVAGFVFAAIGSLAMKRISSDGGLPSDVLNPTMYVAVSLLLQIVALAAMLGPAIRAVREDPVQALRQE
jgi:predicted permease